MQFNNCICAVLMLFAHCKYKNFFHIKTRKIRIIFWFNLNFLRICVKTKNLRMRNKNAKSASEITSEAPLFNEDYIIIKLRKDTSENRENQSEDGL